MHTDVHALQRNVKYLVLCGNTCTLPSEVWTGYICNAMAWERTNPSLGSSYDVTCLSVHLFSSVYDVTSPCLQTFDFNLKFKMELWCVHDLQKKVKYLGSSYILHLFSILHGCVWSCLIFLLLLLQSNWALILSESAYLNLKLSLATTHKEKAAITEIS